MKKSIAILSTLLVSLTAAPFAMASTTAPADNVFRFECPNASGGTASERLTNYGTYVRGMGEENVNGSKVALPMFKGVATAGVPADLATGGYTHAGTMYNAATGRVVCSFVSNIGADSFNVSYQAENIKHGVVQKSDNSAITIKVSQG